MPDIGWPSQLILGGHSFIPELGTDPATDFDEQLQIVNDCLDAGITCIDTTYEPEREQVGRVLEELGRRDEAKIIAWNFFRDAGTGEYLIGPKPYEEQHIEIMLQQLRTDRIDFLVVHPVRDEAADRRQEDVAVAWRERGFVGQLGTWHPAENPAGGFGTGNPYAFMVEPRNPGTKNANVFRAARGTGWRTFATSPFSRGGLLDEFVELAAVSSDNPTDELRGELADALLRFALHEPNVDHLIVQMRKPEWITANLRSAAKGPLAEDEMDRLLDLQRRREALRK